MQGFFRNVVLPDSSPQPQASLAGVTWRRAMPPPVLASFENRHVVWDSGAGQSLKVGRVPTVCTSLQYVYLHPILSFISGLDRQLGGKNESNTAAATATATPSGRVKRDYYFARRR